ncbi:MAG: hypothetical protein HYZ50_00045 [Deltaproteobacteria bacterium]|nr:hypothetical protein [Deltaproteobacteria bacterium]
MRSWQSIILMTVMGIGVALVTSTAALAGPGSPVIYDEDHLKCYKVLKDAMPAGARVVGMANKQFGPERCKVQTRAAFLCAPTVKFNVNDQNVPNDPLGGDLASDFLCYKMRCENDLTRTMTVQDQFGTRNIVTKQAQMLCSPARKINWPTIPCNNAIAPACSGECPQGFTCDLPDAAAATCECRPILTVP